MEKNQTVVSEARVKDPKDSTGLFSSSKAAQYYKVAFVEFTTTATRLIFTVITKLVFVARDAVICLMELFHSVFLIPLDFFLILSYMGLTFIQRDFVERKNRKWNNAAENSDTANELDGQLDAAHKSDIADLNYTRKLFWAGEPISLRNKLLNDRQDATNVAPNFVTRYNRVSSGPLLRIPSSTSAGVTPNDSSIYNFKFRFRFVS